MWERGRLVLDGDADRTTYLKLLRENIVLYGVALIGYCLMSDHIHLIAIPHKVDGLAQALKQTHGGDKGTDDEIMGRTEVPSKELLASGGTPGHIFLRPADDYLRLFTDGKISLGVVPSRPLISRPLISGGSTCEARGGRRLFL